MKYFRSITQLFIYLLLLLVIPSITSSAEQGQEAEQQIRIVGRKDIVVTTSQVKLGDLATVSSRWVKDDDTVIALKNITIMETPKPGKKATLSAARVLERLHEEGVDTKQVGYALPRIMTIQRASRKISLEEIQGAIEEYLVSSERDIALQSIDYQDEAQVIPGITTLEVRNAAAHQPGEMSFWITAKVENEADIRFRVTAHLDEWREIPVAKRPLIKGAVIGQRDYVMARMNLKSVPRDAAIDPKSIIGLETNRDIAYGEVFRKNKLEIPPVIEAGARVTVVYKSKYLTATTTGTALEAGVEGQRIRVRNSLSRKVIMGKVIEPGLVGVLK